jgi:hypothetical protein
MDTGRDYNRKTPITEMRELRSNREKAPCRVTQVNGQGPPTYKTLLIILHAQHDEEREHYLPEMGETERPRRRLRKKRKTEIVEGIRVASHPQVGWMIRKLKGKSSQSCLRGWGRFQPTAGWGWMFWKELNARLVPSVPL